eukprot:8562162-Pyramimonas_sp.AAC.1
MPRGRCPESLKDTWMLVGLSAKKKRPIKQHTALNVFAEDAIGGENALASARLTSADKEYGNMDVYMKGADGTVQQVLLQIHAGAITR